VGGWGKGAGYAGYRSSPSDAAKAPMNMFTAWYTAQTLASSRATASWLRIAVHVHATATRSRSLNLDTT